MALDASVLVAESTGGGDGRVGACAQALLEHCVIVLVDA